MTDLEKLSDRDLLVRIHTILEMHEPRISNLETRMTNVELTQAKASGLLAGAKMLWALAGALPSSAVVYLLGRS